MTRIAFLGLGAMGQRMAAHLVEQHELTVYNRTPSRAQKLVELGATLAEVAFMASRVSHVVRLQTNSPVSSMFLCESLWLSSGDEAPRLAENMTVGGAIGYRVEKAVRRQVHDAVSIDRAYPTDRSGNYQAVEWVLRKTVIGLSRFIEHGFSPLWDGD